MNNVTSAILEDGPTLLQDIESASETVNFNKMSNSGTSSKIELANKLGKFLKKDTGKEERNILFQMIQKLACDAVYIVRKTIAEALVDVEGLPQAIVDRIAFDMDVIAAPFLGKSKSLKDEDLAYYLERTASDAVKQAIAERQDIGDVTVKAILHDSHEGTVLALLNNSAVTLFEASMLFIFNKHKSNFKIIKSLSSRNDVTHNVIHKIIAEGPLDLREMLTYQFVPNSPIRHKWMAQYRRDLDIIATKENKYDHIIEYAYALHLKNKLTPVLVSEMGKEGRKKFFVVSIAILSKKDTVLIENMIEANDYKGFVSVIKGLGLKRLETYELMESFNNLHTLKQKLVG